MTPKLLLKIDEVSEATGWGRTFIYERLVDGGVNVPNFDVGLDAEI